MLKFDLFVLGSGPGGQRAAVQAAKLGKSVGISERREALGGAWINTGTIPSKTFREAVLYLTGYGQRGMYGDGSNGREKITMDDLLSRCRAVIKHEIEVIRAQMKRNGVTLLNGAASFVDPHHLVVQSGTGSTTEIEAGAIVIATGTVPAAPPGVPVNGETVIDSDGILTLKELPRTMTVVGAGVISVEYATMFGALGVKTTVVDKRARLLDFVDAEIAASLSYQMRNNNCTLRLNEDVAEVTIEGPRRAVAILKSGKKIISDVLLYSIGRVGATNDLKLDNAGLTADDRGRLKVNAAFQTAQPHIYAVGDVIGFPSLASTSLEQGRQAACHAFNVPLVPISTEFPYGIYSIPEISMVGRTEEALMADNVHYEVGLAHYKEIARGAILGDHSGMLKLLIDIETRKILGVHIIGTGATELIHIGQAVLAFGGTLDYFVDAVFNYPTFAECYKVAALDGYNKIGPAKARI